MDSPGVAEVLAILRERGCVSPVQVVRRATSPHLKHRNQASRILRYLARVGAAERLHGGIRGGLYRVPGGAAIPEPDARGCQSERRRAALLSWMRSKRPTSAAVEVPGGQFVWLYDTEAEQLTATTAWLYLLSAGIESTREEARQALRVLVAHGFAGVVHNDDGRVVVLAEQEEAA